MTNINKNALRDTFHVRREAEVFFAIKTQGAFKLERWSGFYGVAQ